MATPFRQGNPSANISRIITAAVVNQGFCKLLLSNPEKAISSGYNGEIFGLNHQEKELILSIHATSLSDFAGKLSGGPAGRHPDRNPKARQRKNYYLQ